MKRITIQLLFFLLFFSCKEVMKEEASYNIRTDIRHGDRFFSIYINKDGKAYVIKGIGSDFTKPLKIISSVRSKIFQLDSIKSFYENLNSINKRPVIGHKIITDAARAEIYYHQKKIFDDSGMNIIFLDLFRPIMAQLPQGFNPFFADDHPFD